MAEHPQCARLLFGTACATVAVKGSLLPRGEDRLSPREPTQRLLRTKQNGPGREGRQRGRQRDGHGLDEDMESGPRTDRRPDRHYRTCKVLEAGTSDPECRVAGRERMTGDASKDEALPEPGAREQDKDVASLSGKMGAFDGLPSGVRSACCCWRIPWPLCGKGIVGEHGQKPRGESGGGDNRQGGNPSLAGWRQLFSEKRTSFHCGPPRSCEGSWMQVSGL